MSTLQASLFFTGDLSTDLRRALLDNLYPEPVPNSPSSPSAESLDDFDAYFAFLRGECHRSGATEHAAMTFADLVLLVTTVRGNPKASLSELRTLIGEANPLLTADEVKCSTSLQLAVRLWLMIDVRILTSECREDSRKPRSIPWPPNKSLADVLERHLFPAASSSPWDTAAGEFNAHMNVFDMHRIANFKVKWTNELGDHLRSTQRVIHLYHHVSLLKRMRGSIPSGWHSLSGEIMPRDFIDETLATINLLIPHSRASCNTWLKAEMDSTSLSSLDPGIWYRETADRGRDDYRYWHERLLSLSEAFATAKPANLSQWWYDRRDMGQWWGFWLVIMGIFFAVIFGLIQSVAGILQVVMNRG